MPKLSCAIISLICLLAISSCGKRGPIEPYENGNYSKHTYPAE